MGYHLTAAVASVSGCQWRSRNRLDAKIASRRNGGNTIGGLDGTETMKINENQGKKGQLPMGRRTPGP